MLVKNNDKQLFYINSYEINDGNNSDFSVKLNINPTKKFNKVVLLQASIPKTYYLIQDGYNTFDLEENGVITTITIPVGNYSKESFRSIVQSF